MTAYPSAQLIVAIITLFDARGGVDLGATSAAYDQLAAFDVDAVFAAGTTGEFITLTDQERLDVCAAASDAFGPERTQWHVGSASTHQATALTRAAVERGARHLAAVTPYYFPATESAVLSYFEAVVAAAGDVPVFGYLFPARTTTLVSPALLARIVDTGIAGVKISGEPHTVVGDYVDAVAGRDLPVFSGVEGEFVEIVELGGAGVVSGISSALPRPFLELRDALRAGNDEALTTATERVQRAIAVTHQGELAWVKAVLELRGLPASGLRAPMDPLSPVDRRQLESDVADLL